MFIMTLRSVIVLAILMAVGYVLNRMGILVDRAESALSYIVVQVALPSMVIASVLNDSVRHTLVEIGTVSLLLLAMYVATCLAAYAVSVSMRSASPSERGAHAFAMSFGMFGFVGIPILTSLYGKAVMLPCAIFTILTNMGMFSVGKWFVRGVGHGDVAGQRRGATSTSLMGDLLNPCIVGCIAAIVLALLGVTDAGGIFGTAFTYLGQMTTPGSMIIIGSSLAKVPLSTMASSPRTYVTALMRLVGVPVIVWLVFRQLVADQMLLSVMVVGSGMPVAAIGSVLCVLEGGDSDTMSRGTFVSTMLSIVTIPLITLL